MRAECRKNIVKYLKTDKKIEYFFKEYITYLDFFIKCTGISFLKDYKAF